MNEFNDYIKSVRVKSSMIVEADFEGEGVVNFDYVYRLVASVTNGNIQIFVMRNDEGQYKLTQMTSLFDLEPAQILEIMTGSVNNMAEDIKNFENGSAITSVGTFNAGGMNEYWTELIGEPVDGFNSNVDIPVDYDECLSEINKITNTEEEL
jgi:hypothetical protein